MGEEDKIEPTEAKEVEGENNLSKISRKRKKHLYNSIRDLMEFWFSDVNLGKDRFLSQMIFVDPWVELDIFLKFNKLRSLTTDANDIVKALRKSEVLQVSENCKKVCRITPFGQKENVDACTIYVEQIQLDAEHDWLKSIFSEFGAIDYISLPRFKGTQKPKGFAFIEFKDPESANRAIEAFKAKGFCLSPQMDPDKLVSIATFEKEEKQPLCDSSSRSHLENEEVKQEEVKVKRSKKVKKEEEGVESVSREEGEVNKETGDNLQTIKDKKRRHKSTGSQNEDEENMLVQNVDDDNKLEKGNKRKRKSNDSVVEGEEIKDEIVKKSSKKSKHTVTFENDNSETEEDKKSSDVNLNENRKDQTNVEVSAEKNSENEQVLDEEGGDDMDGDKKSKRKRKKKHKKHISAISFGLQIMPKVEWKRLRNKYLNLQKLKMQQLKQHLREYKWDQRKPRRQAHHYYEDFYEEPKDEIITENDVPEKKKGLEFIPGVIIKVTLDEPVDDVKGIKSQARIHPEIRYVDANEGDKEIYLRVGAAEMADQVLTSKHWRSMELLIGEDEKQYWDKILKDREEKFTKKIRVNKRGRDKLLKKAEKMQGNHVGFDDR